VSDKQEVTGNQQTERPYPVPTQEQMLKLAQQNYDSMVQLVIAKDAEIERLEALISGDSELATKLKWAKETYDAMVSQKDAEIERIRGIMHTAEIERDASDEIADDLRADIRRLEELGCRIENEKIDALGHIDELKSLIARAADALDWWAIHGDYKPPFATQLIQELRNAAE